MVSTHVVTAEQRRGEVGVFGGLMPSFIKSVTIDHWLLAAPHPAL